MIFDAVDRLVDYGLRTGLTDPCEKIYARNMILDVMHESDYSPSEMTGSCDLVDVLRELTDEAVSRGIINDTIQNRDLFDTRLMNCLVPRPAQVQAMFREKYADSPEAATDWFYQFSADSNYIRRDRISRDRKWTVKTPYGIIDITINLSKPEKDPKDIAEAGRTASSSYPKCLLCLENEGYAGRIGHPARENHRIIPLRLCCEDWSFQYSPYVYYNEHCIILNNSHVPMKITRRSFERLFDFVTQFPHYFIGSNADLPIVGGSILSHDHFQGGNYSFAMEKAAVEKDFSVPGFEDVSCGILKWPLSVIRLRNSDPQRLTELSTRILEVWRSYSDESVQIFAETDGIPHNTITPIARRRGDDYEIDLCLRNNLTTPEHPLGLYHPHSEYHHIKKENIGLIEVMGLAVLPSRLQDELTKLEDFIIKGWDISSDVSISKHAKWARGFSMSLAGADREAVRRTIEEQVGMVFLHVLEDCGVFKRNEEGFAAFERFISSI